MMTSSFNDDIEKIMACLRRMAADEQNILDNHRMNLDLIQQCLARLKHAYEQRIQVIGDTDDHNGMRPEDWHK